MARSGGARGASLPDGWEQALEGMSAEQLRATSAQVLQGGADRGRGRAEPRDMRSRVPRSASASLLTVLAELDDAAPPVWRRLEVPSTVALEQLHGVLQAVFGWTDAHLHRFGLAESLWQDGAEIFVGEAELEDEFAEPGGLVVSDRLARLDEVVGVPGQVLRYVYDYGDHWSLSLTLEQVRPLNLVSSDAPVHEVAPLVRCVDGRGLAPPEDVGGIGVWNEDRPDAPFDPAQVGPALAVWRTEQQAPQEIVALLRQVAGTVVQQELRDMLIAADLGGGWVRLDDAAAQRVVRRLGWLLDQVDTGMELTAAGWLPPRVVSEAMTLWPALSWVGKANREDLTEPVRRLRAVAQRLGLVRVVKGRLVLTRAGAALRTDGKGLWLHVAQRAFGVSRSPFVRSATALRLVALAAGGTDDARSMARLSGWLDVAGWRERDGGPLLDYSVLAGSRDLSELLDVLGTDVRRGRHGGLSSDVAVLARVALRHGR